jgi:hypothetical protein
MKFLILRRVESAEAPDGYRVIWRDTEVGSIGLQQSAQRGRFWLWSIDTVQPPPADFATSGETTSRDSALVKFRKAWEHFTANNERLREFIEARKAVAERMKRWD